MQVATHGRLNARHGSRPYTTTPATLSTWLSASPPGPVSGQILMTCVLIGGVPARTLPAMALASP